MELIDCFSVFVLYIAGEKRTSLKLCTFCPVSSIKKHFFNLLCFGSVVYLQLYTLKKKSFNKLLWISVMLIALSMKGERRQGRQRKRWEDNIRPGVRQIPEGSRKLGKMEETDCEIICGAPTTLTIKGSR